MGYEREREGEKERMNDVVKNAVLGAAVGAAYGMVRMAMASSRKGETEEGVRERTHLCIDPPLKDAVLRFSPLQKVNENAKRRYESLLDHAENLAKANQTPKKNQVLTNRMAKETVRDAEALCKIAAMEAEWMQEAAAASIEIERLKKICDNAVHNAVMSGV